MSQNAIKAIPLTPFDASTLTINYQVMNATGLPNACIYLRLVNDSAGVVTVSYDGITDHDHIPAMNEINLPVQSNSRPNSNVACWPVGTKVYVRGTAGTGFVLLAGYYVKE